MNTAAFAHFLRHTLFFFLFLKFINGVILFFMSEWCQTLFNAQDIFAPNMEVRRAPLYFGVELMTSFFDAASMVLCVISVIGFFGATYLFKYPLVNFVVGVSFLVVSPVEWGMVHVLHNLLVSLNILIGQKMEALFQSSIVMNLRQLDGGSNDWAAAFSGTDVNHSNIDYVQFNLKCCGLVGREYWPLLIPKSCCRSVTEETCVRSYANSKSCLYYFDKYRNCLFTLAVECVFFGLLSVFAGVNSLYLTYLVNKYPTGNFRSDSSDDSDSD